MADSNRNEAGRSADWYRPAYIVPGYTRDPYEYPGYYNNLVLAPLQYPPSGHGQRQESSFKLEKHSHRGRPAQLEWATERPTRMRVPLCCEDCRNRLDTRLRDLSGVFDVGIEGWFSALVTVTGRAKERDILQTARTVSPTAVMWDRSHTMDEYAPKAAYLKHH